MSLGYASKLSYREDLGGQLGAPELFDSPEEVEAKAERMAELVSRWFLSRVHPGHPRTSCLADHWLA